MVFSNEDKILIKKLRQHWKVTLLYPFS